MAAASSTLPRSAAGRHSPWLIAVVVSLATFMEVLDTTIANVSLRHIAGGLSSGQEESTWILTSYLISNAIILPATNWLSPTTSPTAYRWSSPAPPTCWGPGSTPRSWCRSR